MFIVIDGIDGSGKDTILDHWVEYLTAQGKRIFNLKEYWATHHRHPEPEELQGYEILVSAEPTYVWTGAAIRNELVSKDRDYSPETIAAAFSHDRWILYNRVILPARAQGMLILQSRSVSSSLAYQTSHGDLGLDHVANLHGNAFTLKHAPEILFIADLHPEVAMQRLAARLEKDDNAVFEKRELLDKLHKNYHADWYKEIFESRGTTIHYFPTDQPLDIMKQQSLEELKKLLNVKNKIGNRKSEIEN